MADIKFQNFGFFLIKNRKRKAYFNKQPRNSKNPLYYRTRTHVHRWTAYSWAMFITLCTLSEGKVYDKGRRFLRLDA